jgi:hypothetical protein
MGFAISGMHYSATQSAIFTAHADAVQLVSGKPIEEPVAWYGPRDEYAGGLSAGRQRPTQWDIHQSR